MSDPAIAAAYDTIARSYDRQLAADDWMRHVLWARYRRAFHPGHHVLDVGCGTGTDAVFLAKQGIRVTAIDISDAMVAAARNKVRRSGVSDLVQVANLDIEALGALPAGTFDGMFSSFAGLNTVPTLAQFAADAARLIRPRGRIILHLLNRSSLWEWAGLVARGQWTQARRLPGREDRTFELGGQPVPHFMPRAEAAYELYFSSRFRLRGISGLGILRPPYAPPLLPGSALDILGRADAAIGSHGPFVHWGRFVVLDMERESGEDSEDYCGC